MTEEYPKSQPPYTGFSDLHFATERQVRSGLVLAGYDRGELTTAPGRVTFRGMTVQVDCDDVTGITLIRKAFPWAIALVVGLIAAALVYFTSPAPFTWRQPLPYVLLIILLVASARQWNERWVEVSYSHGTRRAYFRREPMFLGSGAARTRKLYQELRWSVLSAGEPPPAAPDRGQV